MLPGDDTEKKCADKSVDKSAKARVGKSTLNSTILSSISHKSRIGVTVNLGEKQIKAQRKQKIYKWFTTIVVWLGVNSHRTQKCKEKGGLG